MTTDWFWIESKHNAADLVTKPHPMMVAASAVVPRLRLFSLGPIYEKEIVTVCSLL